MNRSVQGACGHAIRTKRNRRLAREEEEMFDDWTAGYRAGKRVLGMGKDLARNGKGVVLQALERCLLARTDRKRFSTRTDNR
jgi:hypothetical protein